MAGGEEGGVDGGALGVRRQSGLTQGGGGGGGGGRRPGSLPIGYSFRGPAKGSDTNPCVQGDMEPWQIELYGASGRRNKGGP